jgi:molybdopterin/thiamine biosynthesis adenylyltransferase/rhodanese-related sulfurtransferase
MEADDRRAAARAGERAKPRERGRGAVLVEAADRGRDARLDVARRERHRPVVCGPRRGSPAHRLECDAVEEPVARLARTRPAFEAREAGLGIEAGERGGNAAAEHEPRPAGRHVGIEQVLGAKRGRRVRIAPFRLAPRAACCVEIPRGEEREPQIEPGDAASGLAFDERSQPLERPVGPARDCRPDLGLYRRRIPFQHGSKGALCCIRPPRFVEPLGAPKRARLGIAAVENRELERGPLPPVARARLGAAVHLAAGVPPLDQRTRDSDPRGACGDGGDQDDRACVRGHSASVATPREGPATEAILFEAMASELAAGREVDVETARELADRDGVALVDVREPAEWSDGYIPGAARVPRGSLEERIGAVAPDRSQPIALYCASGKRSALAARTLEELGYTDVVSVAGGIIEWKARGFPVETPEPAEDALSARYSRHLLIPEIGVEGQRRLLASRVLLIGAGGLGSPASLYLAAAGVGTLGIVDDDLVDETNLQRQVVHSTDRLGAAKAESAKRTLEALNPDVTVEVFPERLTSDNADRILGAGWDVIVDGADNFPTRYLLNDASVWHGIPVVHGSIFRFEGQATVFKPGEGPCYRCLFPEPPPPELAPSCAEGGVLGVLPGVIGSLQANEALKLLLGVGEPLVGRLLLFDALSAAFTEVALRRDPACPVCGESPTITEYVDYVEFCAGPRSHATR